MVEYLFRTSAEDRGIAVEEFTEDEARLLEQSVTNLDSNVFAWRASPDVNPEQIGALLSRYSRTSFTGRRLFLKEFLPNRDKGREFFNAWLVDYGDDSIQEMVGGIPTACEFVSNLAVKEIEDCRQGVGYIEKSTRYVAFDKKLSNGEYMFYRDPDIMASRHADEYLALMRGLFMSYSAYIPKMSDYLRQQNPLEGIKFRIVDKAITINEFNSQIEEQTGIKESDLVSAYENATRANALDFLRDYLPMSTLTHVGISANGRAYENMINKMLASPLSEARFIAQRLHEELSKVVPSVIKRVNDSHGLALQDYLKNRSMVGLQLGREFLSGIVDRDRSVDLVGFTGMDSGPEKTAQVILVARILYKPSQGASLRQLLRLAGGMEESERKRIISDYVGKRENRRHKPGRAFEGITYDFDLMGRIGIYRDIQRHRVGTQERQNFGVELGYETREEFDRIGIGDDYRQKMAEVGDLYRRIREILPYQAQYVVTFGYNIRWDYSTNARQLYHLCELRSSHQGHPDYRKLVQDMAMEVKKVHPTVIEHMRYLDMSDKVLGRMDSEVRIAQKKKQAARA